VGTDLYRVSRAALGVFNAPFLPTPSLAVTTGSGQQRSAEVLRSCQATFAAQAASHQDTRGPAGQRSFAPDDDLEGVSGRIAYLGGRSRSDHLAPSCQFGWVEQEVLLMRCGGRASKEVG
jgi:hypothetical protein